MTMAAPLRPTIEQRRIGAVEARVDDIEVVHGQTLYELRRESIENKLGITAIMAHLGLPPITGEQVDAVLDEA